MDIDTTSLRVEHHPASEPPNVVESLSEYDLLLYALSHVTLQGDNVKVEMSSMCPDEPQAVGKRALRR